MAQEQSTEVLEFKRAGGKAPNAEYKHLKGQTDVSRLFVKNDKCQSKQNCTPREAKVAEA